MKSMLAISLELVSLTIAVALPTPDTDAVMRILPPDWSSNKTSLRGPGCPDFANPAPTGFKTRLTLAQNTMDGSEIYYWHVAYPYLHASVSDGGHSWCETELGYTEYADPDKKKEGDSYRLRLHKNGTRVLATYDLDEGVKATLETIYDAGRGEEITDEISITGPHQSGEFAQADNSPVSMRGGLYKLPKCGAGTIRFGLISPLKVNRGRRGLRQVKNLMSSTTECGSDLAMTGRSV